LIIITPELVRPIPAEQPLPDLIRPKPFMKGAPDELPRTPGTEVTGPVPLSQPEKTVPVEQLLKSKELQQNPSPATPPEQPAATFTSSSPAQTDGPAK
jgi:hypothetical protein